MSIFARKLIGIGAAAALAIASLGLASGTATADPGTVAVSSNEEGLAAFSGPAPTEVMPEAPGALTCKHKHSNKSKLDGYTKKDNVKTRKGPHNYCKSAGLTDKDHKLKLHCYVKPKGEKHAWVWVMNHTKHFKGWIRWDYLKYSGKLKKC